MSHLPLTDHESTERLRGIGLICAAVTTFTVLDTSAKYAAAHGIPTIGGRLGALRAERRLLGHPVAAVARPADYVTRRPVAQGLRALFLLLSTAFNFIAIQHLQLAQTVSITFAAPLITTALAGPVLGEWAGPRRWAAILVGFIGVIIIVQPEPGAFNPAALLSVGAAFCYAGYALTTRLLSATESAGGMLIYGSLLSAVVLTPALPVVAVAPPDWLSPPPLSLTGLTGAIGHWCLIIANRHAPATLLAPFSYTQLLSMIAAGYLVFGDKPHASTLVGALVIIASGLYVLYRERVHRDR